MYESIAKKETDINKELFRDHFDFQTPILMLRNLFDFNDKEKNERLVHRVKDELSHLKEETENMNKEEKDIENIDGLINIVEEILEFNQEKQQGLGLKILTPNQMLSILPIFFTPIKSRK